MRRKKRIGLLFICILYVLLCTNVIVNVGKHIYEESQYNELQLKEIVDKASTSDLKVYYEFLEGKSFFEKTIGWKLGNGGVTPTALPMENGYYTYDKKLNTAEENAFMINEVVAFSKELEDEGIDFLYVNAPSKINPVDKEIPYYYPECANENADTFLSGLKNAGVNVFDYREIMNDEKDWYSCFYKYDHHWTNRTQLWATRKLAEELNNYGYNFDLNLFDESNYEIVTYKDLLCGSINHAITMRQGGFEDFDVIIPKSKTEILFEVPSKGTKETGDYSKVFINNELIKDIQKYNENDNMSKPNAYETMNIHNEELLHITNLLENNNKNKKILFLYDSYAWYLCSYLSMDIDYIDMIYPPYYDGDVSDYIRESKPDLVIIFYNSTSIAFNTIDMAVN